MGRLTRVTSADGYSVERRAAVLGVHHTILPPFSLDLLVVTQEGTALGGADYPKPVWLMHNRPGELSLQTDTLVYATFFNAGIRVFDTTNPFQPEVVAYFVPEIPEGADANGINDVHVDENGIMYVVDRLHGGLYILELNL